MTYVNDGFDLNNDEQKEAVRLCSGPVKPWTALWSQLVHYN